MQVGRNRVDRMIRVLYPQTSLIIQRVNGPPMIVGKPSPTAIPAKTQNPSHAKPHCNADIEEIGYVKGGGPSYGVRNPQTKQATKIPIQ